MKSAVYGAKQMPLKLFGDVEYAVVISLLRPNFVHWVKKHFPPPSPNKRFAEQTDISLCSGRIRAPCLLFHMPCLCCCLKRLWLKSLWVYFDCSLRPFRIQFVVHFLL